MRAEERKQARALRQQGWPLRKIAQQVGCSKSSISHWIRDIELTTEQIQQLRLNQDRGRAKAANHPNAPKKYWARFRQSIIDSASGEISETYSRDILKLIGSALYWAEGAKTQPSTAVFTNTDPDMVKLMMRFFIECCGVPIKQFRGGVHIHPHLDVLSAQRYWAKISGIPLTQFHKPHLAVSSASRQKKDTLPFGTFRITVNDVRVRSKITGWIEGMCCWVAEGAVSSAG